MVCWPSWNSLPEPIRRSTTIRKFQSRLKTHLFSLKYDYIVTYCSYLYAPSKKTWFFYCSRYTCHLYCILLRESHIYYGSDVRESSISTNPRRIDRTLGLLINRSTDGWNDYTRTLDQPLFILYRYDVNTDAIKRDDPINLINLTCGTFRTIDYDRLSVVRCVPFQSKWIRIGQARCVSTHVMVAITCRPWFIATLSIEHRHSHV